MSNFALKAKVRQCWLEHFFMICLIWPWSLRVSTAEFYAQISARRCYRHMFVFSFVFVLFNPKTIVRYGVLRVSVSFRVWVFVKKCRSRKIYWKNRRIFSISERKKISGLRILNRRLRISQLLVLNKHCARFLIRVLCHQRFFLPYLHLG